MPHFNTELPLTHGSHWVGRLRGVYHKDRDHWSNDRDAEDTAGCANLHNSSLSRAAMAGTRRPPQRSRSVGGAAPPLESFDHWRWFVTRKFGGEPGSEPPNPLNAKWVHQAFVYFCKGGAGGGKTRSTQMMCVKPSRFGEALAKLGIALDKTHTRWLFGRLDRNRDGLLDYDEFYCGLFPAAWREKPAIVRPSSSEQRHKQLVERALDNPISAEKPKDSGPPFLNNLYKEDPYFTSNKWAPMFRLGNATFPNKKPMLLMHSNNKFAPQGLLTGRHKNELRDWDGHGNLVRDQPGVRPPSARYIPCNAATTLKHDPKIAAQFVVGNHFQTTYSNQGNIDRSTFPK